MTIVKTDIRLKQLNQKYFSQNKKPIPFDFRRETDKLLNGYAHNEKLIHYIHTYPGRISPHIPFYLLSLKDFEHLDGYVLDPFAGSGTIILESVLNPIVKRPALAVEINPLARLISKVKTTPFEAIKINELLKKIERIYTQSKNRKYKTPNFININLWFSKSVIHQLARLRYSIEKVNAPEDYKDFFWVCFSKIIRKVSKADPNIVPPVVLKPEKYKHNSKEYRKLKNRLKAAENPDVSALFEDTVTINSNANTLSNSKGLNGKKIKAKIIWDNVKEIKSGKVLTNGKLNKEGARKLRSESIDIILTSPPYLTAQKYIRSTRLELLWLGYTSEDLSQFERSTIGSEYVSKTSPINTIGISSIDKLIKYTHPKSRERGVMVFEYFADMKIALTELFRLLRKGGYAIFVLGDNEVLKKRVKTYRLFTDLAESIGFKEVVILKDRIRYRSMITKRNGTGGLIKNEYIIILQK